jgi:hypothetical protein
VTWAPDDAVVITLAKRSDRLNEFRRHAVHLGFNYRKAFALEPAGLTRPMNWMQSMEAYSNAMSHAAALEGDDGAIMVMEDDALIPADFQGRMLSFMSAVPNDWEFLLLGGQLAGLPMPLQGDAQRLTHFARTHCYVARGEGRVAAVEAARTAMGHWDMRLGRLMGLRGRSYAPLDMIVGITGASSDIPDSAPLDARLKSGSGSSYALDPPCRLGQRYDGRGPFGHARLLPSTNNQGRVGRKNVLDGQTGNGHPLPPYHE